MRAHTITMSLHSHRYQLCFVATRTTIDVLYSGVCRYNILIANLRSREQANKQAVMADVMVMREIEATTSMIRVDLSTVDLDSIHLPPDDDFGIKSDDDDIYQEDNLDFESRFGNIIMVDNLLVVPREKFEKLEGVIRKIYSQIGVIKEDGIWMPVDPDTQKTLGYCFIEYNTPQEAELAKEKTC